MTNLQPCFFYPRRSRRNWHSDKPTELVADYRGLFSVWSSRTLGHHSLYTQLLLLFPIHQRVVLRPCPCLKVCCSPWYYSCIYTWTLNPSEKSPNASTIEIGVHSCIGGFKDADINRIAKFCVWCFIPEVWDSLPFDLSDNSLCFVGGY